MKTVFKWGFTGGFVAVRDGMLAWSVEFNNKCIDKTVEHKTVIIFLSYLSTHLYNLPAHPPTNLPAHLPTNLPYLITYLHTTTYLPPPTYHYLHTNTPPTSLPNYRPTTTYTPTPPPTYLPTYHYLPLPTHQYPTHLPT